MSSRSIRVRLDRLDSMSSAATSGPVCRFHGTVCRMGADWPAERPHDPVDTVRDLCRVARLRGGLPVDPDPRTLWAVQRHEQVPAAELLEREREVQAAIATARADNDQTLARLLTDQQDRNPTGASKAARLNKQAGDSYGDVG